MPGVQKSQTSACYNNWILYSGTNICRLSGCNLLHVTLLASRILRWLVDFWKNLWTPAVMPCSDIVGMCGQVTKNWHGGGMEPEPSEYKIFMHSQEVGQWLQLIRKTTRILIFNDWGRYLWRRGGGAVVVVALTWHRGGSLILKKSMDHVRAHS